MSVSAVEMAAHGPGLSRMYTAPNLPTRTNSMNPYPSGIGHAPRASQFSGTTAFSSSSSTSLSSISSTMTLGPSSNGGPVLATNNIINQKADASKSLYQICVNLRQRLRQVPGFEQHLIDSDDEDEGGEMEMDPMSSLWRCLRKGYPLMTIYNCLQPKSPLQIAEGTVAARNIPKSAAFKFVQACLMELKFEECFVLTDLFGDDTTGFVKVTQVINRVLDVAESRGLLLTSDVEVTEELAAPTGTQMSYRDHVVRELVDTERKYVQDLENLHELKKTIEQKGVITGDVVHDIFLNINAILDFQRRFLIRIETTNSQPESKQDWGLIFVNYEDAFGIYQPFIANQRKAATIAKREFDKISLADHPVVVDFNTLDGFLLKPMQRLIKYPQLLKSLRDKTAADEQTKADLTSGIAAAERVLEQANAAVDRELRNEALAELCAQVEDWKNHEVGQFGDLLLYGQFTVLTGKSDVEKEYTIYLFERILLCCKEVNPNKAAKDKLLGNQKDKKEKKDKDKNKKDKGGKSGKLQLKGRIFMTNVTDVVSLVKPGSYTVQIWWKGDPGIENFIIRFTNDEVMKKWSTAVDAQRKFCTADREQSAGADVTDFAWMRDQAIQIPNPYTQQEDDDDDEPPANHTIYPGHSSFESSRNASSTSLRSRSTTGESTQSLAGMARAPPLRFPMGAQNPPLSVQTQMQGQIPSPSQRGGDSYFSPTVDSPASSRTSQTSSMFPYSRQGTPQNGWEEHNRYTAPAIARAPSRESQVPPSHYQNGRNPQRPSLPAMASQNSQPTTAQQRSRSYSTPDINGPNGPVRRLPNGSTVPAVPGIPAHLHPAYDAGIARSNSNSPSNGLPMRSSTQSPGVQRERLAQHLNTPQYIRSNTTPIPALAPSMKDGRTMSPPLPSMASSLGEMPPPTQLKVKVNCDGNYVTLVVAFNITYQSLIDRIDAKVGRFSNNAIARGTMRLRYRDEDGDFVTIESDEDIQIAFQEWREAQKSQFHTGQLGEIELFCASVEN